MFNPADPSNRVYWMPIPYEYLPAIGAVIAHWGYFEMQFLGFIHCLARHPDAGKFGEKFPRAFGDKAERLRRLARIAFADTPTLAEKVCEFSTRSNEICKKRNVLVHGYWFDETDFQGGQGVILLTEPDGTGDFYSIKLDQIERLAVKISDLKLEGGHLLFAPGGHHGGLLTPSELSAVQEFHNKYSNSPSTPVHRDPNRKGSPQRPEPFRA